MTTTTSSTSRPSSGSPAEGADAAGRLRSYGSLRVWVSTTADGNFDLDAPGLDERRTAAIGLPWTMLDQIHGVGVVRVGSPGAGDRAFGDIALTSCTDAVLGCVAGDCPAVVFVGESSEFAVAHAGWRGLAAGVLDAAFAAMTEPVVQVVIGPTIGPCCYEFGASELALVASGCGVDPTAISGVTAWGTPALDLTAAIRSACQGIPVDVVGGCTGCSYPGFSHRVRGDLERHVVAAWRHDE